MPLDTTDLDELYFRFNYYNIIGLPWIMNELNINWDDVLKKEALGLDDADLGEVQGAGTAFNRYQKRFS